MYYLITKKNGIKAVDRSRRRGATAWRLQYVAGMYYVTNTDLVVPVTGFSVPNDGKIFFDRPLVINLRLSLVLKDKILRSSVRCQPLLINKCLR